MCKSGYFMYFILLQQFMRLISRYCFYSNIHISTRHCGFQYGINNIIAYFAQLVYLIFYNPLYFL